MKKVTSKALLVGINEYARAPLDGCVNDVKDFAHFLVNECDFDMRTVRLLTDKRATRDAIRERLEWLLDGAGADSRLFFMFAGHGTQLPSRNGRGEVDRLDEVLCPVNFDGTEHTSLRDDDMQAIFKAVPKGAQLIWVADCCHSGDLSRDIHPVRRMPLPADLEWRRLTAELHPPMRHPLRGPVVSRLGVMAACKEEQTSADARFDGRPNGAFTHFLLRQLRRERARRQDLRQLTTQVGAELAMAGFTQRPIYEGAPQVAERGFFA